jgi:hypothetical protein
MARLGTNVAYGGEVRVGFLAELGVSVVRVVAHRDAQDFEYFDRLKERGIDVVLTFARESFDGFGEMDPRSGFPLAETQRAAFAEYLRRYGGHIYAWQIANEADAAAGSESSWVMPHSYLNGLLARARETLGRDKYIIGPGLCSGNPEWLRRMDLSAVNGVAIHPYGKGTEDYPSPYNPDRDPALDHFETVGQMLDRYRAVLDDMGGRDLHLHVTEFGSRADELGERRQAEHIEALCRWFRATDKVGDAIQFCATGWMVEPFGLTERDDPWTHRPAFECMQAILRSRPPERVPARPVQRPEPARRRAGRRDGSRRPDGRVRRKR